MKFRKTRKGFTIVELVIVIAVIGILSAILIPTFIHLTNKAEEASDVSLVKNANIQLAMKEAAEGKNTSMNQAVKDVDEIGYHIPGLSLASGNKIVWDSNSDRFVLLNEDNEVKHKDSDVVAPHSKLFKPVSSLADREDFAVYALSGYQENATEVTFTEAIGFDSGDSEITSITYNDVSTEAGDYVFVGTTPTVDNLVINSPLASFKHGGVIREAGVASVKAGESYHELGRGGYIEMGTGDFVAEGSANIKVLYFTDENADYTKISGAVVNEYAKTQGVKDALDLTGSAVRGDIQVKSESEMVSIIGDAIAEFNKEVNPGPAMVGSPVANFEELQAAFATGGEYYLTDNFEVTSAIQTTHDLVLDLNGHNLSLNSSNNISATVVSAQNCNITFNDSVGTGGIYNIKESYTDALFGMFGAGDFTINGGTFLSTNDMLFGGVGGSSGGRFLINGGTILGYVGTLQGKTIVLGQEMTLTYFNDMLPLEFLDTHVVGAEGYTVTKNDSGDYTYYVCTRNA